MTALDDQRPHGFEILCRRFGQGEFGRLGRKRYLRKRRGQDHARLLARRDAWVSGYDDSGQVGWARGAGIEVARGTGRLVGERRVLVTGADGTRELVAGWQAEGRIQIQYEYKANGGMHTAHNRHFGLTAFSSLKGNARIFESTF